MSILDLLGRGARGAADVGEQATRFLGQSPYVTGATMGGLSAGMSGGDGQAVLQGMGLGAAGGVGMHALARLPGSAKMLGLLPGVALPAMAGSMAVRGDVDAAARKILAFAANDPTRVEAAADILYGAREPHPDEMSRDSRGRAPSRNIYGIAGVDEMGTSLSGTERDAALERALEMLAERTKAPAKLGFTPQPQGRF